MFCIAAFIVLAIIGIFSARYRKLAKKAWNCTLRRVTFRPCDTSFKEETKNKLLSHVANRTPKLVKVADIGIEVAAFLFVFLTIWSVLLVARSGLNLYVWGTCNPANASSCSLGAESCSIDTATKDLWTFTTEGKPQMWFVQEFKSFSDTVANIPARIQEWDAKNYLPENASYYSKKDDTKPVALEVIDPGCSVCANMFKNIVTAGFEKKYNLTYIAYPIKNPHKEGEYRFANSYVVASYLEAIKLNQLNGQKVPADWQILERIFTWKDENNLGYQLKINSLLNKEQTGDLIKKWLGEIGYNKEQIEQIESDKSSQRVIDTLKKNRDIVESQIKTVKIPTIIFDGRRNGGLLSPDQLR